MKPLTDAEVLAELAELRATARNPKEKAVLARAGELVESSSVLRLFAVSVLGLASMDALHAAICRWQHYRAEVAAAAAGKKP